ncbi:MAG: hypothetical protein WCI51_03790 [Lentisphaerota bacterium]
MNTQMHTPRPQHIPVNAISIDQLAVILDTPLDEVKEIVKTVKEGKPGKDAYRQEAFECDPGGANQKTTAIYTISSSSHIPGGLALFVQTESAALLQGVNVLIEFELQILGTSSRWSFNPNPEKVS